MVLCQAQDLPSEFIKLEVSAVVVVLVAMAAVVLVVVKVKKLGMKIPANPVDIDPPVVTTEGRIVVVVEPNDTSTFSSGDIVSWVFTGTAVVEIESKVNSATSSNGVVFFSLRLNGCS